MPLPTIDPITMAVALNSPSDCVSRDAAAAGGLSDVGAVLGMVTVKRFVSDHTGIYCGSLIS
jgi:hypothetical protein